MADADDPVTRLIDRLRAGDDDAAERLWRRYFPRLVRLARAHLRGLPCRAADEEDVALGAFDRFCRGVEEGHRTSPPTLASSRGGCLTASLTTVYD
jgi:hypothetical protein